VIDQGTAGKMDDSTQCGTQLKKIL
jgi:hypothetical protein